MNSRNVSFMAMGWAKSTQCWSRYCLIWMCLVLMLLSGCSRAPDEAVVQEIVSDRLQAAFEDPLLEISSMRRLGHAPLSAANDGAPRLIVYYNARLALVRDYAFSAWDALNPAALANLLGATEAGIVGVQSAGNLVGDELLVRGSVTFRQDEAANWVPTLFVPPQASAAVASTDQTGSTARMLIEPIMSRFASVPLSQAAASRAIIAEELEEAVRQIDLRLDNLQRALVLASGPAGGEYDLVARAIVGLSNSVGLTASATITQGSVQNAQLVRDRSASVGLVQNDVALMAYQGTGPFASHGPAPSLRVLGSLFPEPVQIVVRADGPTSVQQLRGLRVDLGMEASGSRGIALRVLNAHGIGESDIQSSDMGSLEAAQALVSGEIDAFFTVINAPARHLQRLAAEHAIRMIPLTPQAITALTRGDQALVPITLPAGTYPGQDATVPTVGVAALLVGNATMPDAQVRSLLQGVYSGVDFVAAGSAAGAMISTRQARTGVTIPMHPGAAAYFEEQKASRADDAHQAP